MMLQSPGKSPRSSIKRSFNSRNEKEGDTMLQPIRYSVDDGSLEILDQLKLPGEIIFIKINGVDDGWRVIRNMNVRGAPAIAITAMLSLAVDLRRTHVELPFTTLTGIVKFVESKLNYLKSSRPTAVNLYNAITLMSDFCDKVCHGSHSSDVIISKIIQQCENLLEQDYSDNVVMGMHGMQAILRHVNHDGNMRILTHCNTGSLATSKFGTALGIVRTLFQSRRLDHCYCTETRPYNQGARLTAFELVYEKIPATLICDSMVSYLLSLGKVDAIVVGADRIVANGDTANKVGTLQLAIAANYYKLPFFIAAPMTTLDTKLSNGNEIVIEERPEDEVTCINGTRIAAKGINVWNPSFDVTPAILITGIITEKGEIPKDSNGNFSVIEFVKSNKVARQ